MYEGIKSLIETCKHVGIMEKMFLESKIIAAEKELAELGNVRETLKTLFIIKRLVALEPMVQGYQGNVDCFFCGTWEDGEHEPDCIWLLAKGILAEEE